MRSILTSYDESQKLSEASQNVHLSNFCTFIFDITDLKTYVIWSHSPKILVSSIVQMFDILTYYQLYVVNIFSEYSISLNSVN